VIPVSKPLINSDAISKVNVALKDGWISSRGKFVNQFEKKLKKYFGAKYVTTCSNGTAALMLALKSLDINNNDEVIVPDLSYAASINSIINVGAKPVICEIEKDSWCIDPIKIKEKITKKTKAVMIVHLYGQACDMKKISKICKENKLYLIEDAAEAFGSKLDGKFLGTFGDVGCFSFFGNKTISTGEGGCCVVKRKKIYDKILLYKNHGMNDKRKYFHYVPGYNFRITNLQSAIGISQLNNIKLFIKKRKYIEDFYTKEFSKSELFIKQKNKNKCQKVNWIFTALFKSDNFKKILKKLKKNKVEIRRCFYPFHLLDIYKKYVPKKFEKKNSMHVFNYAISLPTYVSIKKNELKSVSKIIKDFI
jgi:perosamine synthetase